MEFRTSTFKKEQDQSFGEGKGVIYFLLGLVLFLLSYLLNEFKITGWPFVVVFFAAIISFYLMRYHDWGSKEITPGHLDKELVISSNLVQIDSLTIEILNIDKMKFYIDKFDNQITYSFYTKIKSDGNSNRIEITSKGKIYTEFFRIGTKVHLQVLNKIIKEIIQKGIPVEVIQISI